MKWIGLDPVLGRSASSPGNEERIKILVAIILLQLAGNQIVSLKERKRTKKNQQKLNRNNTLRLFSVSYGFCWKLIRDLSVETSSPPDSLYIEKSNEDPVRSSAQSVIRHAVRQFYDIISFDHKRSRKVFQGNIKMPSLVFLGRESIVTSKHLVLCSSLNALSPFMCLSRA